MTKKTFVLGIGAPKSGTTWLYHYLDSLPVSNMGPIKEYRIWDLHYNQSRIRSRFNFRRLVRWRGIVPVPQPDQVIRMRMAFQRGFYERFFAGLIDDRRWLTGDISPGYMTLTAEQLRAVADRLRSVGFCVKVVFLMRDPVERCLSGARMRKKNGNPDFVGLSDNDALRLLVLREGADLRTRYDKTLAALDAAFDPNEVFTAIYEEFFTKTENQRLSRFLGFEPRYDLISTRWNSAGTVVGEIDPLCLSEVRTQFNDVYDYCADRFPQTRELWH